jgi:hypothetical protein
LPLRVDSVFAWVNFTVSVVLLLFAGYIVFALLSAPPPGPFDVNETPFAVLSVLFVVGLVALFYAIHIGFKRHWQFRWLLQVAPFSILLYGLYRSGNL